MKSTPPGLYLLWGVIFPGRYPGYWMMTPPVSGIRIYSSLGRWNSNITPGFPVTPVLPGNDNGNKTNPTIRDAFPIAPVLLGDDNVNEFNQPGGLDFQ